jgi:hypothetical protein
VRAACVHIFRRLSVPSSTAGRTLGNNNQQPHTSTPGEIARTVLLAVQKEGLRTSSQGASDLDLGLTYCCRLRLLTGYFTHGNQAVKGNGRYRRAANPSSNLASSGLSKAGSVLGDRSQSCLSYSERQRVGLIFSGVRIHGSTPPATGDAAAPCSSDSTSYHSDGARRRRDWRTHSR